MREILQQAVASSINRVPSTQDHPPPPSPFLPPSPPTGTSGSVSDVISHGEWRTPCWQDQPLASPRSTGLVLLPPLSLRSLWYDVGSTQTHNTKTNPSRQLVTPGSLARRSSVLSLRTWKKVARSWWKQLFLYHCVSFWSMFGRHCQKSLCTSSNFSNLS